MTELPFEPIDIQTVHDDVLAIVLETNWPLLGLSPAGGYPNAWCSAMSFTIGRMLLHRGLGTWRIAANGTHDWIEYFDEDRIIYSVDATQHQFPGHDDAWLGFGPPPVAERYPAQQWATCGQEPEYWTQLKEQVVHAEVMRLLG